MAGERWEEGLGLARTMKNDGLTREFGERLALVRSAVAIESPSPDGARSSL